MKHFSFLEQCCLKFDDLLRTVTGNVLQNEDAEYPAANISEANLTLSEKQLAANLMRVNHAGEVCAQSLYLGQSYVCRDVKTKQHLLTAAKEEHDHLYWCQTRLAELGSHTSLLNPLWYAGSFAIGLTAGIMGDRWSFGFIAETESQVIAHLEKHIAKLPTQDHKSLKILTRMRDDELTHKNHALDAGAYLLPGPIKFIMHFTSKIMVKTSFYI